MVAQSIRVGSVTHHIRPFSMQRDLADLADLIEAAFGDDLATTGSRMVEEMRQMAMMGPLLHLARVAVPPMRGYVWVHEGRVVGNVTLARERTDQWTLSNIAVDPDMRGRGIAGHLVDIAVEHVRQRGGTQIVLQVRTDQPVARSLYARRGFRTYDTVHEVHLSRSHWPVILRASDPMIRQLRWSDQSRLREMVIENMPPSARAYRGLSEPDRLGGVWGRVRDALQILSEQRDRIALVAAPDREPVGLISLTLRRMARWHKLELHVLPAYRGCVERHLLQALFARLGMAPRRDIRATISASHPEALCALQRLGFTSHRVLEQMGREL